jgi:TetR/AcrR family transcriptional regulator, transcriptional repressor for nem operon
MNETKLHILKIAFKLFVQKNFKEVTMQDIVKETGLSKGAFYHYFESKEQLFLEVVNFFYLSDEINDYNVLRHTSLKDFYLSYIEFLQNFLAYIKRAVDVEEDAYNNINYFTLVFDALHRFPDFKQKSKESHAKDTNFWIEAIEKAITNGEIMPKMPTKYIAQVFIQSIDATFIHAILEGKLFEAISNIKDLWDNFYELLKR